MSDWDDIRADAREEVAEARISRVNARRWGSVDSASEEPPLCICESCGLDGDCECPEEESHEDEGNEADSVVERGDQAEALGPARRTEEDGEEAAPCEITR